MLGRECAQLHAVRMGQINLIGLPIGNALADVVYVLLELMKTAVRRCAVQVPRHVLRLGVQPVQCLAARHRL